MSAPTYSFPGENGTEIAATPLPNAFIRQLMRDLTQNELTFLLYVLYRTVGSGKHFARISQRDARHVGVSKTRVKLVRSTLKRQGVLCLGSRYRGCPEHRLNLSWPQPVSRLDDKVSLDESTLIPNRWILELLPRLPLVAIKLLLFVALHERAGLSSGVQLTHEQIKEGRDETDRGTGLHQKKGLSKARRILIEEGVLHVEGLDDADSRNPHVYRLNWHWPSAKVGVANTEISQIQEAQIDVSQSSITFHLPAYYVDVLMRRLSWTEFFVLLYLVRHTLGRGQPFRWVSRSQCFRGYRSKSGELIAAGAGLNKETLRHALRSLCRRDLVCERRLKRPGGQYRARFYQPVYNRIPGLDDIAKLANMTQEVKASE